jgi:hypothetical protein
MTAPEPTPTVEHIDAVARTMQPGAWKFSAAMSKERARIDARRLLTTTDADAIAALAASLPAEVKAASMTEAEMLAALVDRGTLTERFAIRDEGGSVWLDAHGDHREAKPGGLEFADRGDAERIVARPHEEVVRRLVAPWEVAP